MSYVIILILLFVWAIGLAAGVPLGGIYLFLPVVAVLVLLLRVVQMKDPLIAIEQPHKNTLLKHIFNLQMMYVILLIAGIVLALFGLNSILHISTDIENITNSTTALSAVWMLTGGVVGTSIGTVGLFRYSGKNSQQHSSSHI